MSTRFLWNMNIHFCYILKKLVSVFVRHASDTVVLLLSLGHVIPATQK